MGYTSERNNQIVIELLKHHGIRKIVVSPGATNVQLAASFQTDSYFELYSSVDERSAAYLACGLSEESGEIVALSCTGATASRNYFAGLTEAYYRKLPILAITSTVPTNRIGHNIPQVVDRSIVSNDVAKASYYIPYVDSPDDEWNCTVKVNEAILELKHNCSGPVHINVETRMGRDFSVKKIDYVRPIDKISLTDKFPDITVKKKIAVFVGSHSRWSAKLTEKVSSFCEQYNAVVIGDHTSNYKGPYFVPSSLITNQQNKKSEFKDFDLMIHLGNVSGAYLSISPKEVWRVSTDGKVCDTYRTLRYVFEMEEFSFFSHYVSEKYKKDTSYFNLWKKEYSELYSRIGELPFSNVWIAKKLSTELPYNSVLHLGILNSLRSWNYFEIPDSVSVYCNTGGFGIDGIMSSALGASLATQKTVFCVLGDLAFFYDMNSLGNRELKSNLRIMVINNGHGQEFKVLRHISAQFGDDTDKYIAAAGHFGNKSRILIKNYTESLGFKYLSADSKESFEKVYKDFVTKEDIGVPVVFEVFTDDAQETEAAEIVTMLNGESGSTTVNFAKHILGEKGVKIVKRLIKR